MKNEFNKHFYIIGYGRSPSEIFHFSFFIFHFFVGYGRSPSEIIHCPFK